ncbi:MAG: DUF3145 domain-containing protein [Actinomycetota bacterium]|nr:DUF3145 domain-containing protein [Actinomycetota bacterium]
MATVRAQARGVVYIHSAPAAICPHAEWAVSSVLGDRVSLSWSAQPAGPGSLRADLSWTGEAGTAGKLANALKAWPMLRFEVTEEPSVNSDGERICHLPGRGVWRATTSANGDIMIGEDRIRALLGQGYGAEKLTHELNQLLGADVDAELEPYRRAGDGTPVSWLHRVV